MAGLLAHLLVAIEASLFAGASLVPGRLTLLRGAAGPAHKLDRGPRAQAPRAARPDERRQKVPRPSAPRARCQQDPPVAPRDVEAEPAAVAKAVPLSEWARRACPRRSLCECFAMGRICSCVTTRAAVYGGEAYSLLGSTLVRST